MTNISRRPVRLIAAKQIIVDGAALPPGEYDGTEKQITVPMIGGRQDKLPPEYEIHVNEHQAAGIEALNGLMGATLNAPPNVKAGELVIGSTIRKFPFGEN